MATPYIGNNDYRGFLNYLSQNGNADAGTLLRFVGNDGGINTTEQTGYYDVPGAGNRDAERDALNGVNADLYKTYRGGATVNGLDDYARNSGTSPSYNPDDIAYLDDQEGRLRNQIGSIDRAEANGVTQLEDSYNKEVGSANSRRGIALEDFNTKRTDTERAKTGAIERVDTGARTLADSLRRRIGMASGSGSSAFQITAPGAVAREASQNRTGVLENFGANIRDLKTGEDRATDAFDELLLDLEAQKKTRTAEFKSGILDRRNQVDGSLAEIARQRALVRGGGYNQVRTAMAPYTQQIDSRTSEIDGLFEKYRTPYAVKQIDVKTPNLRDYTVDRAAINANAAAGGNNPTAPYLKPFKSEEEQQLY